MEPYRAFSGEFNLRLDPKRHEKAAIAAAASQATRVRAGPAAHAARLKAFSNGASPR